MSRKIEDYNYEDDYRGYAISIYIHPDESCSAEIRDADGEYVIGIDNCETYEVAVAASKKEIDRIHFEQ